MRFQIQLSRAAQSSNEMSVLLATYTCFSIEDAASRLAGLELKAGQVAELLNGRGDIIGRRAWEAAAK